MAQSKPFKTYAEQVELLRSRGMIIEDTDKAIKTLERLNYYCLSGYWHPMRRFNSDTNSALDEFVKGASFELVIKLYEFDKELRHIVFTELGSVETVMRSKLGYELGKVDPYIHLNAQKLGAVAFKKLKSGELLYEVWLDKYQCVLKRSKEDYVAHHKQYYDGRMPIWVAVEIMDWGMLSHLYGMSPNIVRNAIAKSCSLTASQLESWLKSLNIVRNYAAHHVRMFNRSYDLKPKLPRQDSLRAIGNVDRVFIQLSLIQFLHRKLDLSPANHLPKLLETYPENALVPFSRIGAPIDWRENELWKQKI